MWTNNSLQTAQGVDAAGMNPTLASPNGESINQVLMINGIASVDEQIKGISQEIKQEMVQKQALRGQLNVLNSLGLTPKSFLTDKTAVIPLTPADEAALNTMTGGQFVAIEQHGARYITTEQLSSLKDAIGGKIQDLNSGWELRGIELQSLMDQRKNMILMLSNLMAVKNESLMGIIRNFKS